MEEIADAPVGFTFRPTDTPVIESILKAAEERGKITFSVVRQRIHKIHALEPCLVFLRADVLGFVGQAHSSKGSTGQLGVRLDTFVWLDLQTEAIASLLNEPVLGVFEELILKRQAWRPEADEWVAIVDAVLQLAKAELDDDKWQLLQDILLGKNRTFVVPVDNATEESLNFDLFRAIPAAFSCSCRLRALVVRSLVARALRECCPGRRIPPIFSISGSGSASGCTPPA